MGGWDSFRGDDVCRLLDWLYQVDTHVDSKLSSEIPFDTHNLIYIYSVPLHLDLDLHIDQKTGDAHFFINIMASR